jgi:nitrogen PTS system EIIA component
VTIYSLLDEGLILHRLAARDREGILREMSASLEARHKTILGGALLDSLQKREELGTTAIGRGVAIPHCRTRGLKSPILLLGLSKEGVPFEAVDGKPAHVFFLLVSPEDNPSAGLRILAAIATLTRESRTLAAKLLKAPTGVDVLKILRMEEEKTRG